MYDHINDHITVSMDLILNYKTYSVISVSSSSYFRLEWQRTLFYTCMLNKLNQLMVLRTSLSLIRIISCVGAATLHDEFTSRLLPATLHPAYLRKIYRTGPDSCLNIEDEFRLKTCYSKKHACNYHIRLEDNATPVLTCYHPFIPYL